MISRPVTIDTTSEAILSLDRHPFFIGLLDGDRRYDHPEALSFALGVDARYAIARQLMSPDVRAAVHAAYAVGSMCSTPLGESQLAARRLAEFKERLVALLGDVRGLRLLEIGAGNGELLHEMHSAGADVTGLEIGPQADVIESRYGLPVIRQPLSHDMQLDRFDCIYSYGCLEHIEELDEFFAGCRQALRPGGLMLHSVPNASLSFERESLEHLQHEHVNYFTVESANALFRAQGFIDGDSAPTRAGNELMIWGRFDPAVAPRWPAERVSAERSLVADYARRLDRRIGATMRTLDRWRAAGHSIGFYAGGYDYGARLGAAAARYFDGDSYKHGKRWLPSLPAIESPDALRSDPVDHVIICKPHYFEEIRRGLVAAGISSDRLTRIDMLPEAS